MIETLYVFSKACFSSIIERYKFTIKKKNFTIKISDKA